MLSHLSRILLASLFPMLATAKGVDAVIVGDSYLGVVGRKVELNLADRKCTVSSMGTVPKEGESPAQFKIELSCDGNQQTLWDISKPNPDDFAFDDPKFSVLWAGDRDGDGKIDFEMDLSPKYSCSRKVLFLSSRASKGNLVGIGNIPKIRCED